MTLDKLDQIVESLRETIIADTQTLVRFPSTMRSPEPGAPFGQPVRDALDFMYQRGRELGFTVFDDEGYAGHLEFGEGEELGCIIGHLDVVPEGSGWKHPPFAAEIADGRIYGRGTIDDKGPTIAALYAMHAVRLAGIVPNKRFRLILGCNEETGWACVDHYFLTQAMPDFGFSPDGNFPIIYAEKGIITYALVYTLPAKPSLVKELTGGNAVNMVPDACRAVLAGPEAVLADIKRFFSGHGMEYAGLDLRDEGGKIILESVGVGAHGSHPELGRNAIWPVLAFLAEVLPEDDPLLKPIRILSEKAGSEYYGAGLRIDWKDEPSGRLTCNLGTISLEKGALTARINIRYPVTLAERDVRATVEAQVVPYDFTVGVEGGHVPLHVPKDHPLIQTLSKVYTRVTGQEAKLLSIGGGTYARALKNAVAFGAVFPGETDMAHQTDEFVSLDSLQKMTRIMAHAVAELIK